jgi:DNA-binding NarL/FixJ family response regulator
MAQPARPEDRDDRVAFVSAHPSAGLVLDVYEAEPDGYYVRATTSHVERLDTVSAYVRAS